MLKNIIRSIAFALLTLAVLSGALGMQAAEAKTLTIEGTAYLLDTTWNGRYDWTKWDTSHAQSMYIKTNDTSIGKYRIALEKKLGYATDIFALVRESCSSRSTYEVVKPNDDVMLSQVTDCPYSTVVTLFVFIKDEEVKPLYNLWLMWKDDGTVCYIRSTRPPSVESQKRVCFPGDTRYPEGWVADKSVCSGLYYSNGKWDCDPEIKKWLGKKGE
jgi:hypothetical protein